MIRGKFTTDIARSGISLDFIQCEAFAVMLDSQELVSRGGGLLSRKAARTKYECGHRDGERKPLGT